jgi:hypothetical protein
MYPPPPCPWPGQATPSTTKLLSFNGRRSQCRAVVKRQAKSNGYVLRQWFRTGPSITSSSCRIWQSKIEQQRLFRLKSHFWRVKLSCLCMRIRSWTVQTAFLLDRSAKGERATWRTGRYPSHFDDPGQKETSRTYLVFEYLPVTCKYRNGNFALDLPANSSAIFFSVQLIAWESKFKICICHSNHWIKKNTNHKLWKQGKGGPETGCCCEALGRVAIKEGVFWNLNLWRRGEEAWGGQRSEERGAKEVCILNIYDSS